MFLCDYWNLVLEIVRLNQLLSKEKRDECESLRSSFCFVTGYSGVLPTLVVVPVGYIGTLLKTGPQLALKPLSSSLEKLELLRERLLDGFHRGEAFVLT